eukprot:3593525-Karenia_brevis.AAC.1
MVTAARDQFQRSSSMCLFSEGIGNPFQQKAGFFFFSQQEECLAASTDSPNKATQVEFEDDCMQRLKIQKELQRSMGPLIQENAELDQQ